MLLPATLPQLYNNAIKEIFTRAGLTRLVTVISPTTGEEEQRPLNEIASSHLARRTFVANLYNCHVDRANIAAMSGHSQDSKAFDRYHDVNMAVRLHAISLTED